MFLRRRTELCRVECRSHEQAVMNTSLIEAGPTELRGQPSTRPGWHGCSRWECAFLAGWYVPRQHPRRMERRRAQEALAVIEAPAKNSSSVIVFSNNEIVQPRRATPHNEAGSRFLMHRDNGERRRSKRTGECPVGESGSSGVTGTVRCGLCEGFLSQVGRST